MVISSISLYSENLNENSFLNLVKNIEKEMVCRGWKNARFSKKYLDRILDKTNAKEKIKMSFEKLIRDNNKIVTMEKVYFVAFLYKNKKQRVEAQNKWFECFGVDCVKIKFM